jgi:Mrp family chromosome partitioning ATPase
VPLEPGFSELLRGEATLDDVLQETTAPNLYLLPAGRCDRKALHALAQDSAADWFERVKERFDFVLIDSCPVLPVTDALLLAQHADAVLFSVLREVSRLPQVKAALGKMNACGGRVLGAVVNGTVSDVGSYGRRYLYGPEQSAPSA